VRWAGLDTQSCFAPCNLQTTVAQPAGDLPPAADLATAHRVMFVLLHPGADSVTVIVQASSQAINGAATATSQAVARAAASVCTGGNVQAAAQAAAQVCTASGRFTMAWLAGRTCLTWPAAFRHSDSVRLRLKLNSLLLHCRPPPLRPQPLWQMRLVRLHRGAACSGPGGSGLSMG